MAGFTSKERVMTAAMLGVCLGMAASPRGVGAQSPPAATIPADARYTAADVTFMQGMIGHHAQALAMSALVADRSTRPELALLAERITVSQRDEMAIMQRWLSERKQPVPTAASHDSAAAHALPAMPAMPATHAMHGSAGAMHQMPGMLSPAQMDSLTKATGPAFDRLFLQYMIQHHEGALTMVAELLRTPNAAREPMVFQFVSDVDTDQRSEIRRMQLLLRVLL